jgi:DNA-binding transcriptional regulator YbjK
MPSKQELLDLQFIDARHMLINLAACLDRIDRHPGEDDYRLAALKTALPILLADRPDRAKAVLESFSDRSTDLPQTAPFQGATGAPR